MDDDEWNAVLVDSPVVLAWDMGGVTGWSIIKVHPEALTDPKAKILGNIEHKAHGQIDTRNSVTGEMECIDQALDIAEQWPGAAILMEDFILRMMTRGRELLAPVRLNAMYDFGLHTHLGVDVTHRQQPSEAKSVCTDERLKAWDFYESKGGLEHARDADRHAILFLRKAKDPIKGAIRRALWWPHLYGEGAEFYVPPPKSSGKMQAALEDKEPEALAASTGLEPIFQAPNKRPTRKRTKMRSA